MCGLTTDNSLLYNTTVSVVFCAELSLSLSPNSGTSGDTPYKFLKHQQAQSPTDSRRPGVPTPTYTAKSDLYASSIAIATAVQLDDWYFLSQQAVSVGSDWILRMWRSGALRMVKHLKEQLPIPSTVTNRCLFKASSFLLTSECNFKFFYFYYVSRISSVSPCVRVCQWREYTGGVSGSQWWKNREESVQHTRPADRHVMLCLCHTSL